MKIKKVYLYIICLLLTISCVKKENVYEGQVMVNGVSHLYKIVGKGDPIVILHGGPGMFHDYLVEYLKPLSEKYKLIFYDQRGNGGSNAKLTVENFTIDQLVDDLEGLRKSLSLDEITVLGHSWGGLLAQYYAIKYPNKIKRMILVNSASATSKENEKADKEKNSRYSSEQIEQIQQIIKSGEIQKGNINSFKRLVSLIESVNLYDPNRIDEILTSKLNYTKDKVRNALIINELKNKNTFFNDYDITKELEKIKIPTLVIHGQADFILESSSIEISKKITKSKLIVFNKSGHFSFAEEPSRFLNVVNSFLKNE